MAKKKAKVAKKQVVKHVEPAQAQDQPMELTEEQIEKTMQENEEFQDKFLQLLANTDRFEVIPTQDEHGNIIPQEQLFFIKKEVKRLGLTTVYAFENGSRFTILMCPREGKLTVGMVSNGAECH